MKVSFTDWKIDDQLQTPKDRDAYIRAAGEEGASDALPDAFADVFRAMGKPVEAAACDGLATYLRTIGTTRRIGEARRDWTNA